MTFQSGDQLTSAALNGIGIWQSYSPTWSSTAVSQPALGNGTLQAKYGQIGKTVYYKLQLKYGSTTTAGGVGDWGFSLPVTAASVTNLDTVGDCLTFDSGTAYKNDMAILVSTTLIRIVGIAVGGYYGPTTPQTWATNDSLALNIVYEAA